MHYVLHILLPCIIVHLLGHGGQSGKAVVSPEVLTTFAKNIASVLSPSLLSDFQSLSSNRSVISGPTVSRKKSLIKEPHPPYSIRSRRSEPDNDSSNTNEQNLASNFNHENYQQGVNIDNGIGLSNDISDIRASSFNEVINQAPTHYTNQYHLPDFLPKSRDLVADVSNLNTDSYRNYVSTRNKLHRTDDSYSGLRDTSETTKKPRVLSVNREKDITPSPVLRLSVRSPARGYNGAYENHRPNYAPVQRRTNYNYNAHQQMNNEEGNTDDPGSGNAEGTPNAETPERPNYEGYGFPAPNFPNAFYGGPNYNFPPYGNPNDGTNLTDGNYNYQGFGGFGFDPYNRFNKYPNFYGHRQSYLPGENSGSVYQPEYQSDNNSTSDDVSGRHPYGYPYGNQGYPFGPQFGFNGQGFGSFKGPFGSVPGGFLDPYKKVSPYPGFHQEPFPFLPHSPFRPPYGEFYPNHNFRRPSTPSTTPSDSVSPSEAAFESPESVSESILTGDAELISESVQKGVIQSSNNNSKIQANQKEVIKRFVLIGNDGCKD